MAIDLSGIANWLHGWFPYHSEVVAKNQTSANASKNLVTDSSGEVTTENKVSVGTGLAFDNSVANKINHSNSITAQSSTALKKISFDGQGHITGTENVSSSDLPSHSHIASDVSDSNAHSHISTSANDSQATINTAIDTAIGNLQSIKAIEVVSTLPTASASTMGKLYIISENSKVNVYYTIQSSSTYSWHKMDADILDELVVNWSDVQNKPSTFTPSSHTHGNITNDGILVDELYGNPMTNFILWSDSSTGKIDGLSELSATKITDSTTHSNIGTLQNANQKAINTAIDSTIGTINTSLSGKASASDIITSIVLVPKSTDANGKIIFYTSDEPS